MCVYRFASLEPMSEEILAVKPEKRYQRLYVRCLDTKLVLFSPSIYRVVLLEFFGVFTSQLCSQLPRSISSPPICSAFTILDFDNMPFRTLWNLRAPLQESTALSSTHYPETLHITVIVNTPAFFPAIWAFTKVQPNPTGYFIPRLTGLRLDRTGSTRERGTKSSC